MVDPPMTTAPPFGLSLMLKHGASIVELQAVEPGGGENDKNMLILPKNSQADGVSQLTGPANG